MAFVHVAGVVSVFFLVTAFLLYTPLPEVVEEPTIYRTFELLFKTLQAISFTASKFTSSSYLESYRYLIDLTSPRVYHQYKQLEVEDLKFEGVPVRVYKPKSVRVPSPCVIFLHGGGWTGSSVDSTDRIAVNLALETNMIVVSVEYRLAPEHPYPAPLDDCLRATKYVLQNGQRHGVDVHRVAIAGESSGGNLATAVALRLAEEDAGTMPPIKLQVLIYPVTQLLNFRTSSYLLYRNYPLLNQRIMTEFAASYLLQNYSSSVLESMEKNYHITSYVRRPIYSSLFKEELLPEYVRPNPQKETVDPFDDNADEEIALKMDSLAVDPYVSPLMADNATMSKLPSSYFVVCEFDVLRDEGLLYVHRLRQAGVKVELSFLRGQFHNFMTIPWLSVLQTKGSVQQWETIYTFLKENL